MTKLNYGGTQNKKKVYAFTVTSNWEQYVLEWKKKHQKKTLLIAIFISLLLALSKL